MREAKDKLKKSKNTYNHKYPQSSIIFYKILKMNLNSAGHQFHDLNNSDNQQSAKFWDTFITHIKGNNYFMCFNSQISVYMATFLYLIREFQVISLVSLPPQQGQKYPEIQQLIDFYFIIDFQFIQGDSGPTHLILSGTMLFLQLITFALMCIHFQRNFIAEKMSKIITIVGIITPMFITSLISKNTVSLIKNYRLDTENDQTVLKFLISVLLFILTLITQFIFVTFHFQCSLKFKNKNSLSRFPKTITKQYSWIFIGVLSGIFKEYAYPQLFIVYQIIILFFSFLETKHYCINTEYINADINRNLGILSLLTSTFCLGNISHLLGIKLFRESLIIFIIFFFIFATNFYLTYRSYHFKKIIIDDDTPIQQTQITYVLTYILISQSSTEKKNQTYLSSFLRNHINNCQQTNCCCKQRNENYDPKADKYGDIDAQPHLDNVFIKHFLLLCLVKSIEQFPKSIMIKIIHCIYYLEFVGNKAECVKYLQYFSRKTVKQNASASMKYVIFCIEKEFIELVKQTNEKKGNQVIENVKKFDDLYLKLINKITQSIYCFHIFWSKIQKSANNTKNVPRIFFEVISNFTLGIINQIQEIYTDMKNINSCSNQLRDTMLFFARQIVHDLFLADEIKQAIKQSFSKNNIRSNKHDEIRVDIFNQNTASLIAHDINSIKWVSSNASTIFGYKERSELLKMKTNNLMPIFFAKNHDYKVKYWLQTGKCDKMNKNIIIWASMKNGACFKAIIYLKVMPNIVFNDLDYYISIEYISKNEIICSETGEILGCDEMFSNLLQLELKTIQLLRPNIHFIFPQTIQIFGLFTPELYNPTNKKIEAKYAGYIPDNSVSLLSDIGIQRQKIYEGENIYRNHDKFINDNRLGNIYQENIELLYKLAIFFSQQMHEFTRNLNGRYLTLDFEIDKTRLLSHKIFVFRINKSEANNIQAYYDQLQKAVQLINEGNIMKMNNRQDLNSLSIDFQKKPRRRKSVFNYFINPRRGIKMAEKQIKVEMDGIPRSITIKEKKQRAKNKMETIKNPKVKANINKMKRVLYNSGIFSYYTYSQLSSEKKDLQLLGTIDQNSSSNDSDDLNSFEMQIQGTQDQYDEEKRLLKEEDKSSKEKTVKNISFAEKGKAISFQESQASSTALISLTTKIKGIKQKLKAKDTPLNLIILNIFLILMMMASISACVYILLTSIENFEKKSLLLDQQSNKQQFLINLMNSKVILAEKALQPGEEYPQLNRLIQQELKQSAINYKNFYVNLMQVEEKIGKTYKFHDINVEDYGYIWKTSEQFLLEEKFKISQNKISMIYADLYNATIHQYLSNKNQTIDSSIINFKQIYVYCLVVVMIIIMLIAMMIVFRSNNKMDRVNSLLLKIYPQERQYFLGHFQKLCRLAKSQKTPTFNGAELQKQKIKKSMKTINMNEKSYIPQPSNFKNECYNKIVQKVQQEISSNSEKSDKAMYYRLIIIFLAFSGLVLGAHFIEAKFYSDIQEIETIYRQIQQQRIRLSLNMIFLEEYAYHQITPIKIPSQQLQRLDEALSSFQLQIVQFYRELLHKDIVNVELKNQINKFSTTEVCTHVEGMDQTICRNLAAGTFIHGGMNSYYIIIESIKYYHSKLKNDGVKNGNDDSDDLSQPDSKVNKFSSKQLSMISSANSQIGLHLLARVKDEIKHFSEITKNLEIIFISVVIGAFGVLLALWKNSNDQISQRQTICNSYLLMIPFQILIENPYIKLYIKKNIEKSSI